MTILGKFDNKSYNEEQDTEQYEIPRVFNKKDEGLSLKKSIVISTLLHPISVLLSWLLIFILAILGVNFDRLKRPEPPMRDIEFVLVNNPEATPINKNTKNRADRNTRAGGKHNPKKPQAEPSPAPGAQRVAAKKTAPAKPKQVVNKTVVQPQKQPVKTQQPVNKPSVQPKAEPSPPKNVTQTQTPPPPRPKPQVSAPKVSPEPKSAMQIPVPKTSAPKLAGSYGGPVTGVRTGSSTSHSSTGIGRPAPSFAPSSGSVASGGGRFSTGQYGTGQAGNPGPGNPNGRPGIDAIKEPDFGPYMRELQRRIKMNWDPPKGNESKRVILLFKIAKDGRLLSVKVSRSSGVPAADRAAISAVELTAPFKPLPPEFKGGSVDIQFTFDYNVFGGSRY